MTNKSDELAVEIIEYFKDVDLYNFRDCYETEQDAFNDVKDNLITVEKVENMIYHFSSDIECYGNENDLSDKEMKKIFDKACNMIVDLNQYKIELERLKENNKDIDL